MSGKRVSIILAVVVMVIGLGAGVYALIGGPAAESAAAGDLTQSASTSAEVSSATDSSAGTTVDEGSTDTGTATAGTASSDTASTSVEDTEAGDVEDAVASPSNTEYVVTDTSYESATTSITITKVSTGSGDDAVTYYIADVLLTPGTDLQAGLADGFERGKVDYTSSIAAQNAAILAINGDYCTARDTGVIIRNGVLYLDNPARVGLAIYQDGTMQVYDEFEVSAEELLAQGVWNTYSFGPALLVDGAIPEGLDESEVEDIGEKHTILGSQPRTGIGIIEANHFVFVVVDGREAGYSTGVTLSEFAQIFEDLGCTTAYNLDGGGSSTMYFNGEVVNDPLGEGRERGISDILFVG